MRGRLRRSSRTFLTADAAVFLKIAVFDKLLKFAGSVHYCGTCVLYCIGEY